MSHELIIHQPQLKPSSTGSRIDVKLESPVGNFDLFMDIKGAELRDGVTPFVAICVPLAMTRGWNIRCEQPISERLMEASHTIQDIIQFFRLHTQRIKLNVPTQLEPVVEGRTAASYFSGGVDSYYTYLKHKDRITKLIFGWGFDIKLEQETFAQLVTEQIQQMADELGVGLIQLKTNIREFTDPIIQIGRAHV